MPAPSDLRDLFQVVIYTNLANLADPVPTLVVPAGLQDLITAVAQNRFDALGLKTDIQDIVDTTIANNRAIIITTPP